TDPYCAVQRLRERGNRTGGDPDDYGDELSIAEQGDSTFRHADPKTVFCSKPASVPHERKTKASGPASSLTAARNEIAAQKTRRAPASIVSNVNEVKSLLPWIQLSAPPIEKVIKRVSVRVEANKTRNIRATFICSPRGGASPNWVMEELSIWRLASFVQCGNTFV